MRELSKEESPKPGKWKSVPWQREILDALADPLLQWIVILKATQMGVSELVRCAIGRWAIHDPGDVLWVMTTEAFAKRAMKKLRAMFAATPALRRLVSTKKRDSTLLEMVLTNGMRIVIGWAGSAQSLSSDAFRRVILDEVAKYAWTVQGEGSPVDLARARTKTWGRRGLVVLLSSPRHQDDPVCTEHRKVLDRRTFRVPCPSCHHLQPAEFDRLRWPGGSPATAPTDPDARVRLAELLEREQSAWMECVTPSCEGRIQPAKAQEDARAGWAQEEPAEASRRRAYHVPEFWHWETSLSDLAVKWLRAIHPTSRQEFVNGSLGLADRDEQTPIEAATIEGRAVWPPRLVPSWATTVIATADTQLAGWWIQVRAWGRGGRSRLLDWAWLETEEELLARGLRQTFQVDGGGGEARIAALAIDTGGGMETPDGSRTEQVYRLIRRHPKRIYGIKGDGSKDATDTPWRRAKVLARAKAEELEIYLVNRAFYADQAAALIRARPVLWEECRGAEHPDYAKQMASEKKVLVTSSSGSEWVWTKRAKGVANHQWDLARYQVWLAEFLRVERREVASWQAVMIEASEAKERHETWPIGRR